MLKVDGLHIAYERAGSGPPLLLRLPGRVGTGSRSGYSPGLCRRLHARSG